MIKLNELMKLERYKEYTYIMCNEKENNSYILPLEIIQSYKNELKVTDIYDYFGVVVEVKFNKTVWRIMKTRKG